MPQRKYVAEIQDHFVSRGWTPLLPIKVNGLLSLDIDELQTLVQRVKAATDRLSAVTQVVAAIQPRDDDQGHKTESRQ